MVQIKLDRFKQSIAEIYDRRQDNYDFGDRDNWHYQLANRLVECAEPKAGQQVLEPQQLKQFKAEYISELKSLVTEKGIWNDITTYFALSEK